MVSEKNGAVMADIHVNPRSSVNRLEARGDELRLKITAPPVDGEANQAVIEFFSDLCKVPKRAVTIIRGETSKNKTVKIDGISQQQFLDKIR